MSRSPSILPSSPEENLPCARCWSLLSSYQRWRSPLAAFADADSRAAPSPPSVGASPTDSKADADYMAKATRAEAAQINEDGAAASTPARVACAMGSS